MPLWLSLDYVLSLHRREQLFLHLQGVCEPGPDCKCLPSMACCHEDRASGAPQSFVSFPQTWWGCNMSPFIAAQV